MAQQRIYKQPNRGRRDNDSGGGMDLGPTGSGGGLGPDYTPGSRASGASGASAGAGQTLGNIDEVLNDVGGGSRGVPQSVARAERNRRSHSVQRDVTKRSVGDKAGGALSSGQLANAEKENMIGGFYRAAGLDENGVGEGGNKLIRRVKGINRRRKILAGAGVGGVTGILISALLLGPIYRVPGMISDLEGKIGAQVNDIVETRAERMVIDYLLSRAGVSPQNYVITGSPLSDLWRTFQSRKIEKQIEQKLGIKFVGNGDGTVRIIHDGRDLGHVRNYEQIEKIISAGSISTKADFREILKGVLPAVRFHKASLEARSFKIRFLRGLPFSTPKLPDKADEPGLTDAARAAEAVELLTEQQVTRGTAETVDAFRDAVLCPLDGGSSCDRFAREDPTAQVPDADSEAGKQISGNGTLDEVFDEVDAASNEAKKEAIKDRTGGFVSRLLEKLLAKVIGAVAAKTITGAIPYVGWIDTFATLQHALGTALSNHLASRIPIIMKESAYGALWSTWEGYAHNEKAGKVAPVVASTISKQIKDGEKSEGYHQIYDQTDKGVKLSPKVGSNKTLELEQTMDNVYNNLGVKLTLRAGAEGWYYTVGKVIKYVSDLGGGLVSWLFDVLGFKDLAEKILVEVFGENWKEEFAKFAIKGIFWLLGIVIDPLAKGAEMFNNLFAGAAVALNYYCHINLGCRALTLRDSVVTNMRLQEKQRQDIAMMSLKDRLFSTEEPNSLVSTLIRNAPADNRPSTIVSSVFSMAAKLPSSIVTAFSPKARAADFNRYSEVAGVQWYGGLPSDYVGKPVAPEIRQQQNGSIECPKTNPDEEFNLCQADYAVYKSMNCIVNECDEFKGQ